MSLHQPSLFDADDLAPDQPGWTSGSRCDRCHATGETRRRPGQPYEDDFRCPACGQTGTDSWSRVFGERAEEMKR